MRANEGTSFNSINSCVNFQYYYDNNINNNKENGLKTNETLSTNLLYENITSTLHSKAGIQTEIQLHETVTNLYLCLTND